MDNLYGNSSGEVPKRGILSPIHNLLSSPNPYYHRTLPVSPNPYYHQIHPMFDPYASSPDDDTTVLETVDPSLVRYLQSRSPVITSSDGEHSPSDGYRYKRSSRTNRGGSTILELPLLSMSPLAFKSATPGKIEEEVLVMDGVPVKSPTIARVKSSSSVDSGKTSSSSGKKNNKKEPRRSDMENSGNHNNGLKHKLTSPPPSSQFAHGKQELPPRLLPQTSKLEIATSSNDWSPQDDGIEIHTSSNKSLPREAIDEHINKVLYGTRLTKRLPVFESICPE